MRKGFIALTTTLCRTLEKTQKLHFIHKLYAVICRMNTLLSVLQSTRFGKVFIYSGIFSSVPITETTISSVIAGLLVVNSME